MSLRGAVLSLGRPVLALRRSVLTLGRAVGRLRLLGVAAAATAAVIILSRHGDQKIELLMMMRSGCLYRKEGEVTACSGKKRRKRCWLRGGSVLRPRNIMYLCRRMRSRATKLDCNNSHTRPSHPIKGFPRMLQKSYIKYCKHPTCAKGLSAGSPSSMAGKTATLWRTLLFTVHR